jgi:hypothetical protein
MAKGTFPIITCDHEDGCDQWTLDWYEAQVNNWQQVMDAGWFYEPHPYGNDKPQLCPNHAAEGDGRG